eukprot:Plantae.Rhodophyta-Rhodochaete_pulchella.ctg10290.p1 GENE.Plantae.Rhodophyta-Rhodochaete_pulchella.ctg10290~~Plantae.Rhodophyta-Rhodochaete_pulchella.ctg10290.p1  ORF type:complete len:247 (-),score=34.12 Plantae.Rhodophyta-Rhodochaete_pulchella.ctg10290:1102-1842(-)
MAFVIQTFTTSRPHADLLAPSFLSGRQVQAYTPRIHTRPHGAQMQFDLGKAFEGMKESMSSVLGGSKSKETPKAPAPPSAAKSAPEERPVESLVSEPQPGEPGYQAPSEPETGPQKVMGSAKRGFELLKRDLLKTAPERAGVGRQDKTFVYQPQAGEPGYKQPSVERVKVSQLGISPFSDDKNFVSKVGGKDAVVKAAEEVEERAKQPKMKGERAVEATQEKFEVPDYLKSIPEDTPRRGYTWKNW